MRVLFIEDSQDDVLYVQELLREAAAKVVELECAPGLSAGIEMLAGRRFDIVLLDLSLPESRGLDTFERVRAAAPETPVVVLSGLADDATAIEAVRRGAQDYLVKGHAGDGLLLVRTLRYAVERDQSRKAMEHRVEMEKLVSAISTGFVNLKPGEIDRGIMSALQRMGRFCGVDRSYVFLLSDDGKTMDNTHEWCADGIGPQIANLKGLVVNDFPWSTNQLRRLETVHVPRVCDLPPEADPEKESFQAQRIQSLVLVPMSSGGRLIGFLGFDSVGGEKTWSEPDVTLLRVVGEIVVSAIEHNRAEDEIARNEARFRAMFESSADCILVIGADCRYLFANKATLEFLGLVGRNIVGKHVAEVLAAMPEIQEPWMGQLAQVLATAEPLRVAQHLFVRGKETWGEALLSPIKDLSGKVFAVGIVHRDVTEQKRAETALRESEERYRHITETLTDYIFTVHIEDGRPVRTVHGPACVAVTGYAPADFERNANLWIEMVPQEDREAVLEQVRRTISDQEVKPLEHRIVRKDGAVRWVRNTPLRQRDRQGRLISYEGLVQDVTERRQLTEQFLQAQKMEAIGLLAGGVAHDFRNQLTVIKGFGEMLLRRSLVRPEARQHVEELVQAADRSAELCQQLLAFSRQQPLRPQVVPLGSLLTSMGTALERMIGEDVRFSLICPPDTGSLAVDPGQFQQAVMNLVANARDAMPKGGELTIETANVDLDSDVAACCGGVQPGPCVLVTVTDTGHGMNAETAKRVFEPYFTTKPFGRGTGLGLSMVYGFVKQSGGSITVESVPGRGTTFRMCFPGAAQHGGVPQSAVSTAALPVGTETILVVEDEAAVRRTLVETLRECGYTVLEASGAAEALSAAGNYSADIRLVISDVIMPGVSGPAVVNLLRRTRPEMRALYISGYSGGALRDRGIAEDSKHLLTKPVDARELAETVRRVLDAPG